MATAKRLSTKTVDGLLKAMLVLSRTVDAVLEGEAVEAAVSVPLSASKVQILRLLSRRGGLTASQVARFLGVSNPAVSQIVDSMVRDKLVVRRTGQVDRREVNLQLTEQGKRWSQAVRDRQRHMVRAAVRSLRATDIERWESVLENIAGALGRADSSFSDFCAQCGAHSDGSCVLVDGDASCLFVENGARRRRRARATAAKTVRKTQRRSTAKTGGRTGRKTAGVKAG